MTERKIKQIGIVLSPKRAKTDRLNLQMCRERNYAVKHCHFFLWAITLNIVKILSMGKLYTHLLYYQKKISGEMVFSGPLWPVFITNFGENLLFEV